MTVDPMDLALAEADWLRAHPQFDQKPASVIEFLGKGYLDIERKVRDGLKQTLADIFGHEVNGDRIASYEEAMVTGGIGIGKTTFASIALPYMVHWTLCLRDPQDYFDLLPGSRIAFMQMSTSEKQALQVIFGDIKARVQHSEWFVNNYPYDPKFTKQIRFPKDIWILPGDSAETTFEGYNILAGILDEMDSHKQTQDKDYADVGFDTINSRIASRFVDAETNGHKGLLICIGQMKKGNGFAAKKYKAMKQNPKAHVTRMTIWESLGWKRYLKEDGTRDSFWYDSKRKMIVPDGVAEIVKNEDLIEVPTAYRHQFDINPQKALRDLAGIPPLTDDPFILLVDKIESCRDRWMEANGEASPVKSNPVRVEFEPWFMAKQDPRKRTIHIDLATSGDGDALGMAMGHVSGMIDVDGEDKPYVVIDCLIRIKAPSGQEIMLSDVRRVVYHLRDDLGFRVKKVTMDGFQSTDTMQQLRKKRFQAEYLSVDRNTLPYEDLRDAIYEDRISFPKYMTYLKKGDTDLIEIAYKELTELTDTGKKIDHPTDGSKDVADAMAGVVSTLMGDRTYRRGQARITSEGDLTDQPMTEGGMVPMAPTAPSFGIPSFGSTGTGMGGLLIPDRLRRG